LGAFHARVHIRANDCIVLQTISSSSSARPRIGDLDAHDALVTRHQDHVLVAAFVVPHCSIVVNEAQVSPGKKMIETGHPIDGRGDRHVCRIGWRTLQ
jgi:hypothetical protein